MFKKKIDNQAEIHELIASRWSGRAYDREHLLTREQILSLLEAARWAPSCFGDQPWRFIVFDKASNEPAWQKAVDCLVEGNRQWAQNAPLLLLACSNPVFDHNGKTNRWSQYDTGAASENLCLQATAMGMMAHQMGGFDAELCRACFAIPAQFVPMAMIAVGYQLAADAIPEDLYDREHSARSRNVLDKNFFEANWDSPVLTGS